MKISISLCLALVLIATVMGCAATSAPVSGMIFTNVTAPVTATGNTGAEKEGKGSCVSILGLFAFGDCSIATAAKEAGITKIRSVDHSSTSVLSFFASYTVIVKGE